MWKNEPCLVIWTSDTKKEALSIASLLLEEKLIACANIVPKVTSIYLWEGEVEKAQEVKVFFKTRTDKFPKIQEVIIQHCSYDVPEILQIPIVKAHKPYLDFIDSSLQTTT